MIARIPDISPKAIYDLGCGTGELTNVLAERWKDARVKGVDSSPEMVEKARESFPHLSWEVADINGWMADTPPGLIYSNATLHWLDDHETLFRRLCSYLTPGGVLAVQMPDNWAEPTHRVPAEILDSGDWPEEVGSSLIRDRLATPSEYASWLSPSTLDMWRTTYFQQLTGEDPVWEWVTGSVLRPVLAHLGGPELAEFEKRCKLMYREAYPENQDGTTTIAFSRLFLVAQAG